MPLGRLLNINQIVAGIRPAPAAAAIKVPGVVIAAPPAVVAPAVTAAPIAVAAPAPAIADLAAIKA